MYYQREFCGVLKPHICHKSERYGRKKKKFPWETEEMWRKNIILIKGNWGTRNTFQAEQTAFVNTPVVTKSGRSVCVTRLIDQYIHSLSNYLLGAIYYHGLSRWH